MCGCSPLYVNHTHAFPVILNVTQFSTLYHYDIIALECYIFKWIGVPGNGICNLIFWIKIAKLPIILFKTKMSNIIPRVWNNWLYSPKNSLTVSGFIYFLKWYILIIVCYLKPIWKLQSSTSFYCCIFQMHHQFTWLECGPPYQANLLWPSDGPTKPQYMARP